MKRVIFLVISICFSLCFSSKAQQWTQMEPGVEAAGLSGNFRYHLQIGSLRGPEERLFEIALAHRLIPTAQGAFSSFEVPQLSSYLLPLADSKFRWKPPYDAVLILTIDKDFAIDSKYPRIKPSEGQYIVTDTDGTEYWYREGELFKIHYGNSGFKVVAASGRIYEFQDLSGKQVFLKAEYSFGTVLKSITFYSPDSRFYFDWQDELLVRVTRGKNEVSKFAYNQRLIAQIKHRDVTRDYEWKPNSYAYGFTALTLPLLLCKEGAIEFDYVQAAGKLTITARENGRRVSELCYVARSKSIEYR